MNEGFLGRHKGSVLLITLAFSAVCGVFSYTFLDFRSTVNGAMQKAEASGAVLEEINQKIAAEKAAKRQEALKNYNSTIVVINKKHCFEPKDWQPNDLISIENEMELREEAAKNYTTMQTAAQADGAIFAASSAYRSYDDQVETYDYWEKNNGTTAADNYSARAGCSEHQTGLVVDLKAGDCALECFADTKAYQWLTENAADYGFIQRYQEGFSKVTGYGTESWHWRYVGRETALDMKKRKIATLEEYFEIEGGDYDN